jgi:cobalt/nickel transport system ATP-binding protein
MSEPLFQINDVSFSYDRKITALHNCSLSINKGDRVAIIGANGTGKSTLLTMFDALIFPHSGTFSALGRQITEKAMNDASLQRFFRSKVGFVFQNPDVQLFCSTVKDDIVFGPLQLGVPKNEIQTRLDKVVECLKIGHLLERSPHQLSLGEKKKAAIASVLVMEPEVLLLDEPTAGLDPQTVRNIISVLYTAHKEGKTIVMTTHDLHIVEEIADVVHVFGGNGGIIRSGSPEVILADQSFLQENNLTHIHIHRHLHSNHVHSH